MTAPRTATVREANTTAHQNWPGSVDEERNELLGEIGPQHVKGAVGEVQNPQDAEDQREAGGDQKEKHRIGETVQ